MLGNLAPWCRTICWRLSLVAMMLLSPSLWAASDTAKAAEAAKETGTTVGGVAGKGELSVLPVISSLFVVIVVILLLALAVKRFNLGFPGSRAIKVVTALSLGAKERLVVVEINGKQHVLGVTSNQINHLLSLDEPLESQEHSPPSGQQPLTFQKILENLGNKK